MPDTNKLALFESECMAIEEWARRRYDWFSQRIPELEKRASENGGRLSKEEVWRAKYFVNPYMLLEPDEVIIERLNDILTNSLDLSIEGKITLTPMVENKERLSKFITQVIAETNLRGILHRGTMQPAYEQINSYFENGTPPGARMFQDFPSSPENHLFKFSKKEFVDDMYKYGRFRISQASYYSKGSHLRAVKDLETQRNYKVKAIHEAMEGLTSIEVQGHKVNIVNGVIPINFYLDDYFLFSTCNEVSRRMPTDFEADSVLVIKNKGEFLSRLKEELLISYPGWEFLERDVYYYDSYNNHPEDADQEFYKHISYSYQREHRCIIRPKYLGEKNEKLSPFFVEIGPLNDICEVINC